MNTIESLLFSVAFLVALNISCHVIYDNINTLNLLLYFFISKRICLYIHKGHFMCQRLMDGQLHEIDVKESKKHIEICEETLLVKS